MKFHYKKIVLIALLVAIVFNFLFLPLTALGAQTTAPTLTERFGAWVGEAIGSIGGGTLLFVSSGISYLLGVFASLVLSIEAGIIDYVINPSNFPITNAKVVTIGWGITRDLANMFFILILLVIAFATVLKIRSYAINQLWWKVLVAALLINFSLVIAGFVIDFANILTAFFLNQITGSFGTITTHLAQGMQILNFYNPAKATSLEAGVLQFGASGIAAFLGIILTLIGLVVTVFVFGATVVFLIVRILHLWFLLIIAPIAWMLWILPATSGQFSKWWDNFIKWAFFAPIYVFFIYLSLQIFDASGKLNTQFLGAVSLPATWSNAPTPSGLTTAAMPAAIFQWILVIAMMFGSLIVAQKLGVEGARAIRGATKGAAKATGLWATKSYGRMATGLGDAAAGVGVARSRAVRIITAPIRGIGTGLRAIGSVATGARGGRLTAPLAKTPNNPWKAIKEGVIKGSGLFKKTLNVYECQACGDTVQSKNTPTYNCPICGVPAATANWQKI